MQHGVHIILLLSLLCHAQVDGKEEFALLRQNDQLGIQWTEDRTLYSSLKYTPLGNESYLSIGGSYRFQAESFFREQFRIEESPDHIWFLNRFMLYSLLELNNKLRFFFELNSSTAINKTDISPVDKDVLSVNQFFGQYQINNNLNVLLGRENLMFGSRRLVDIREGPNVRRSFDLARLNYEYPNLNGSLFYSRPVVNKSDAFDNGFINDNETLLGTYNTIKIHDKQSFDIYWLFQDDDFAIFNNPGSSEKRHSIGVRHFGSLNTFRFNNEFVYQFGSHGTENISAWTISLIAEHPLNIFKQEALIGLKSELISGDKDPEDSTQSTFDALYPRGAYFGRVARFGPANLIDIHPYLNLSKGDWYFEFDYDAFWRYSIKDAVYNAALFPEYNHISDSSFIAQQFGGLIGYSASRFCSFELESNVIFPGAFLKDDERNKTLYHFVITTDFKF